MKDANTVRATLSGVKNTLVDVPEPHRAELEYIADISLQILEIAPVNHCRWKRVEIEALIDSSF